MNAIQTQLLDLHELDEVRCTTQHHDTLCSVRAEYRVISCTEPRFWCAKRYKEHLQILTESGNVLCSDCDRPVELCWKVVAV